MPHVRHALLLIFEVGRVFRSGFSARLASDSGKSRENSFYSNSLKVKF